MFLRRSALKLLLVLFTVCAAVATLAPGAVRAEAPPLTAAQQLDWVLDATNRTPVPEAEIEQHLGPAALAALGGADRLNYVLASVADLRIEYRTRTTPTRVDAVTRAGDGQEYTTTVEVDADGLITVIVLDPREAGPTSWGQVDRQLRALAPTVSFATSRITADGTCRRVHGMNPSLPQPLGSGFKLYVLGALARAVQQHTASWSEKMAIRDDWKSLPSGELQNEPAGTKLTLAQYADSMISISDNTAADHLLHFLGRKAVEQQVVRFGNANPQRDVPFLTTRELFVLKGYRYPTLARTYLAAPRALRPAVLAATALVPRSKITPWSEPRDIDTIETFASADDGCRTFAGLLKQASRPGMAPLAHALSINDGSLGVDPRQYPTVWFKGGSEPGALTLQYLVRDRSGAATVVSVLLSDRTHAFDEDALIPRMLAIVRGALALTH